MASGVDVIRVRVLATPPTLVDDAGSPRNVEGQPGRLLLLLTRARGTLLAPSRLASVWDGHDDAAFRRSLTSAMDRLRTHFDAAGLGRHRLPPSDGGYRLTRVDGCRDIDADVMTDLANEAVAAVRANDAAEARRLAVEGLALWSEVPSWPEAEWLYGLHASLLETAARAGIALGERHHVDDLWSRARTRFRPEYWSALLRALEEGSTADEAARACDEADRAMASEAARAVAFDPGPLARDIERMRERGTRPVGSQVPGAPQTTLVGDPLPSVTRVSTECEAELVRSDVIKATGLALEERHVCVVTGPPGVGKSVAARRYAERAGTRYATVAVLTGGDATNLLETMVEVGRHPGVLTEPGPTAQVPRRAAMARLVSGFVDAVSGSGRALVLVDQAERADLALLDPLLEHASTRLHVLLTSTERLKDVSEISVEPLDRVTFGRAVRAGLAEIAVTEEELDLLWSTIGGYPGPIAVAVADISKRLLQPSVADYVADLAEPGSVHFQPGPLQAPVAQARALQAANPAAFAALGVLSACAPGIALPVEPLTSALSQCARFGGRRAAREALEELAQSNWVAVDDTRTSITVHQLMQAGCNAAVALTETDDPIALAIDVFEAADDETGRRDESPGGEAWFVPHLRAAARRLSSHLVHGELDDGQREVARRFARLLIRQSPFIDGLEDVDDATGLAGRLARAAAVDDSLFFEAWDYERELAVGDDSFAARYRVAYARWRLRSALLDPDDTSLAESHLDIGRIERELGHHDAARRHFLAADRIYTEAYGVDDGAVADVVFEQGRLEHEDGHLGVARALFGRARRMYANEDGEGHWRVADVDFQLGKLERSVGHIDLVRVHLSNARRIYAEHFGESHWTAAQIAVEFSVTERQYGSLDAAREFLARAAQLYGDLYGEGHWSEAQVQLELGRLQRHGGQFEAAREHLSRAASVFSHYYGDHHWTTADVRLELGRLERELSRFEAARAELTAAHGTFAGLSGNDHWSAAQVGLELARVERELGQFSAARHAMQDARRIFSVFGDDHWTIAEAEVELARVQREVGCFDAVRESLLDARRIYSTLFGHDHWTVANVLLELGRLARELGHFDEASAHLIDARRIYAMTYPDGHWTAALMALELGRLERELGLLDAAHTNFVDARRVYRNIYGDRHWSAMQLGLELARVERELGQYETARKSLAKAKAAGRELYGGDHWSAGHVALELAQVEREAGALDAARKQLRDARRIHEKTFDEDHWTEARAALELGRVERGLGAFDAAHTQLAAADRIYRAYYGGDHHAVGHVALEQARLLRATGQEKPALEQAGHALEILTRVYGPESWRTSEAVIVLARLQPGVRTTEAKAALAILEAALPAEHRLVREAREVVADEDE